MSEKWEYKLLLATRNGDLMLAQDALDEIGADGWEMVTSYVSGTADSVFVFKRPKSITGYKTEIDEQQRS